MSVSSETISVASYWNSQLDGRNRRSRNQSPNYTGFRIIPNSHDKRKQRQITENSENDPPQPNSQTSISVHEISDVLSEIDEEESDRTQIQLSNAETEIQNETISSPNFSSPNTSSDNASSIIRTNINIIIKAAKIWLEEKNLKSHGFYAFILKFFHIHSRFKTNITVFVDQHDKQRVIRGLIESHKNNTLPTNETLSREIFTLAMNSFTSPYNPFSNSSSSSSSFPIQVQSQVPTRRAPGPPISSHPPTFPATLLLSETNFPHQRPVKFIPNRLQHSWTVELSKILENFISGFNSDNELEYSLDLLNLPAKFMYSDPKYRHRIVFSNALSDITSRSNTQPVSEVEKFEQKKVFLLKKCKVLIKNNQPGDATNVLKAHVDNQKPLSNFASDPVLLQNMKDLHPQPISGSPNLVLPDNFDNLVHVGFNFSETIVRDLVLKLPKLKSNGFSAWTFDLITQSIKSDKTKRLSLLFTEVFNLLASGKVRHKHLWISSRLLAISKKDSDSIRPIAIGEAFIRVVGKLITAQILGISDVIEALYPSQCGVGVKGGGEIVAHAVTIAYHKIILTDMESSIISYDTSNAFNTISRQAILDNIVKVCPILSTYFLWQYGDSSSLYDGKGKFICLSSMGVRQGDPLGPLLFALGISPILKQLKESFPTLEILAYLDDIYNIGKTSICEEAFMLMSQAFSNINLNFNIRKCKHLNLSTTTRNQVPILLRNQQSQLSFNNIPIVTNGLPILKVPVGTNGYVKSEIHRTFDAYTRVVNYVNRLDADDAFVLTKLCINTCPNYIARTVDPKLIEAPVESFDNTIDKSIAMMMNVPYLYDREKIIRHLPQDKGGLGICSYKRVSPLAWSASFYSSLIQIESRFERIYDLVLENKDDYVGFDEKYAKRSSQKDLCAVANKELFESFLSTFPNDDPQSKALFVSQATHGTSKFLHARYSEVSAFIGLHHEDFSEGLRKRLLMTPTRDISHLSCICRSNPEERDRFHVYRCNKYQYIWNKRHDLIRDELCRLIKSVRPTAYVNKEQNVTRFKNPSSNHHQQDLRCDIMATETASSEQFIIDVSVTDPTCKVAIKNGSSSVPSKSASLREKEKRSDYKRYLIPDAYDKFVPFVIESTGRFGQEAMAFIDKICKLDKLDLALDDSIRQARWNFLHSVSNILVTANARVARHCRCEDARAA